MITDLFTFQDYRDYLKREFAGTGEHRGRRSLLAKHLACQTSFLSQVLTDRTHLTLEHAIRTAEFLGHTPIEKRYFILLVQKERSGSHELKAHFETELSAIRKKRDSVKERINVRTSLSPEDQMIYYSAWHYSAIHVLSALPDFNSLEAIASRLKIEMSVARKALEFLIGRGFVKKTDSGYTIGSTRIHLPKGSPMLPRHHANWRMKAIERADHEYPHELHYSAVLGISKKDIKLLKGRLLKLLEDFEPIAQKSPEEEPVVLLLDLFSP